MAGDKAVIRVGTRCRLCQSLVTVDLTEEQYKKFQLWESGVIHIQDAIPEVAPQIREVFISGTCAKCWDEMFGSEEDWEE